MFAARSLSVLRCFQSYFQVMHKITSSVSNSLDEDMKRHVKSKQYKQALELFKQSSVHTDVSINMALKACISLKDYEFGKQIEKQLSPSSQQNEFIQNSLFQLYMHIGDMNNAEHIHSKIKNVSNRTYAILFKNLIQNYKPDKVLDFVDQMKVMPDEYTLTVIFSACAKVKNARAKQIGMKLFDEMSNHFNDADVVLQSAALNMLMSFGQMYRAETLFNSMKQKNIVSYGALMEGYFANGMHEKVLDLFEQMPIEANSVVYTIVCKACAELKNSRAKTIGMKLFNKLTNNKQLITDEILLATIAHMLINFGDITSAERLFGSLEKKDAIVYGTMMKCYNINNMPLKSLQLFKQMKKKKLIPTPIHFTLLLQSCAQIGLPLTSRSIIDQIPLELYDNIYIVNGLINILAKIGSVDQAYSIFKSVKKPDAYTYNIMINAYGLNGQGADAINLYYQMSNNQRDEISHVAVLNACSHSGLVDPARSIFNKIDNKSQIIYTTMVDCLSRLHIFDEAEKLIQEYEQFSKQYYLPMHMALLSGARNSRQSVLASRIYQKMKQIFPNEKHQMIPASILLSNIYTSIGDDKQASQIRHHRLKNYGKKVTPGEATTEDGDEILSFKAHDHSHPLSNEIHAEAMIIGNELRQHGHQFDASWITRPLKETETVESVLCGHSERLAIAYHFIRGKRPSKIHIVKNLRVCGDCHEATKLIAKIRQCEIFVRDANRMHHFQKNGQCSCNDHF